MYKIGECGATYMSLPPNMQDEKAEAFGYAFDKQMKKLIGKYRQLNVWGDIDHVDPKFYDAIAASINAPYYKSSYSDERKLHLIKNAILSLRYGGTVKGMNEFIDAMFDGARYVPWYRYGGDPYHFKIQAQSFETREDFGKILKKVKAARSILDKVEEVSEVRTEIYPVAYTVARYAKNAPIKEGYRTHESINTQIYAGASEIHTSRCVIKEADNE